MVCIMCLIPVTSQSISASFFHVFTTEQIFLRGISQVALGSLLTWTPADRNNGEIHTFDYWLV